MRLDLSKSQLLQVQHILAQEIPAVPVMAFGSRVNRSARPFSDLDLLLMSSEPLPGNVIENLKEAFSESDLPIRVDIVDYAATTSSFRAIIDKAEKVWVQEK